VSTIPITIVRCEPRNARARPATRHPGPIVSPRTLMGAGRIAIKARDRFDPGGPPRSPSVKAPFLLPSRMGTSPRCRGYPLSTSSIRRKLRAHDGSDPSGTRTARMPVNRSNEEALVNSLFKASLVGKTLAS
jgi:hypothetical protein